MGLLEATPILVLFTATATQNCSESAACFRFGIHPQMPRIEKPSTRFELPHAESNDAIANWRFALGANRKAPSHK